MKKLLMLSFVFAISVSAYAQTDSTRWDKNKQNQQGQWDQKDQQGMNHSDSTFSNMADGFVKKDGQMMSLKDGELKVMESDTTLSNGTLITSTGNYKLAAGNTTPFTEGSHIDIFGKITPKRETRINEEEDQNDNDGFMMPDGDK